MKYYDKEVRTAYISGVGVCVRVPKEEHGRQLNVANTSDSITRGCLYNIDTCEEWLPTGMNVRICTTS